jgi:hypothetical protein
MQPEQPTYLGVDLGIAMKFACGCFFKYYYEIEKPGETFVDRDREYCVKHSKRSNPQLSITLNGVAEPLARAKADEIREAVAHASQP